MSNLFDVSGKIALVTGGAKGIGAMISEGLVKAGVKVYVSSRSAKDCQSFADTMSKFGSCVALPMDLSTVDNIKNLVLQLKEKESKLDILINNAGVSWGAAIDDFPEKGWDKVMDLNLKSIFFLTQQLLPLMRSAATIETPANVINISSVMAVSTVSLGAYSYSASKAAVMHLSKCLAKDIAHDHIKVNAIGPGFFPTNMTSFLDKEAMAKEVPLKRLGLADDIAGTVIYLCSRAGGYTTGAYLPIDGGFLVR